jgi:hypothetical protein
MPTTTPKLLPMNHPLVPKAQAVDVLNRWHGELVFHVCESAGNRIKVHQPFVRCPHKHGPGPCETSKKEAECCAERARDQLRAGKEIDW